ncbi:regulator of MON1-CCZ1 complex [Sipha flava]|uniref:Regulator of MON1-CCZ1 complex n=1 Tax=Sipha flava TaxID=143950 RepID=A0A2S2PVJ5_9HEMI|nr:regulator of MON1-CCZ1 complex [Sipha flava]
MASNNCCLQLNEDPIQFDPASVSKTTNVFYDEITEQIITVHSGEMTEIIVTSSTRCRENIVFKIEDRGPVSSIKMSLDCNILTMMRTTLSVELMDIKDNTLQSPYFLYCKLKSAKLLGFIWTSNNEILLISDKGVELYQIEGQRPKQRIVFSKSVCLHVNWFIYSNNSKILLLSTNSFGDFQPLHITSGNITKLAKLEVDLDISPNIPHQSISERNIVLTTVYNILRILVLPTSQSRNEIIVYSLNKMMAFKKSHILRLTHNGKLLINVVDSLIVVHYQHTKSSSVFDIYMEAAKEHTISHYLPILDDLSIQRIVPREGGSYFSSDLYSHICISFQPNVIIDAKLGFLWHLKLDLAVVSQIITDKCSLIDFLLLRPNSKDTTLQVLQNMILQEKSNLIEIGNVFDHINIVNKKNLNKHIMNTSVLPIDYMIFAESLRCKVVIEQIDVYKHIFVKLVDQLEKNKGVISEKKLAVSILVEYIRSLTDNKITVEHFLYELLINCLVINKMYYQLHQMIQYHILTDSKPLACLLLSLESIYPPAHQMALDMLHRLNTAHEEITEVLLSKKQIIPAMRYMSKHNMLDHSTYRKLTELAISTNDSKILHSTREEFIQRNVTSNKFNTNTKR